MQSRYKMKYKVNKATTKRQKKVPSYCIANTFEWTCAVWRVNEFLNNTYLIEDSCHAFYKIIKTIEKLTIFLKKSSHIFEVS